MEFLGSGNAEEHLKRMLQKSTKVTFHGRQSGDAYWRILAQWDCVLYTSDFEGSPLAMQEALNAGCLPIYPRIHSGGDRVVQEVYPDGLYTPEDYASIAQRLSELTRTMESEIEALRQKAISVSQNMHRTNITSASGNFGRRSYPVLRSQTHPPAEGALP